MPNDRPPIALVITFGTLAGAISGQLVTAYYIAHTNLLTCTADTAAGTAVGGGAGCFICVAGHLVCCLLRDNHLGGERTPAPTQQIMFSEKFSNDIKELYNELGQFIKTTENKEEASKKLYKLVQRIAATQNDDAENKSYVEMLRALVSNPVETIKAIGVNNQDNQISLLVASLILSVWQLDKKEELSLQHQEILEKIVESQSEAPAQQHMNSQSSQPPAQTIGITQGAQPLTSQEQSMIDALGEIMQHAIQPSQSAGDQQPPSSPSPSNQSGQPVRQEPSWDLAGRVAL